MDTSKTAPANAGKPKTKTLTIEVEILDDNKPPQVKVTPSEDATITDLMVMISAAVGVIYAIAIQGLTHAEKKRRRVGLLTAVQRYMTGAEKGGVSQKD